MTPTERKRIYRLLDDALADLHIAHTLIPKDLPALRSLVIAAEQAVARADKAMRRNRCCRGSS